VAGELVVRVRGVREVVRAFRQLDRDAGKAVQARLAKAADPVAQSARDKLTRYRGASLGTIRPRATATGRVFVTQRARKRTGKRGDFGALQMTHGLMPALEEHRPDVIRELEHALDDLVDHNF
jgi:hypothetical protein